MDIFKSTIFLLLSILPLVVLFRDWKFHDKRTVKHHNITKSIIILWCVGSVVSTYFVWQDSSQLTELIDGKNTLIDQNNNLSNKIEEYKNNVDEKQKIIKELEGKLSAMDKYGEIAKWNFLGQHHLGGGIVVNTPVSGWADNYLATHNDRMSWKCSEDAKNHYQSIISSNPDFPFPYYFLAFCLNQQKDESWIEYAQKGVNILQHTTIVPEHDPSHDDVLNRLNGLFRHRND